MACLKHHEAVLKTKAWKIYARRTRKRGQLFFELIRWIELGALISIGEELGWFPDDHVVQDTFATFEGWEQAVEEVPDLELTPLQAVRVLQQFRNYIHPGKCIREKMRLHDGIGKHCLSVLYSSLGGVLQYHSDPDVREIVYEVPQEMKVVLNSLEFAPANLPAIEASSSEPELLLDAEIPAK